MADVKTKKSVLERFSPILLIALILIIWQALCSLKIIPGYMLPSPVAVIRAFLSDFPLLMKHLGFTMYEALFGVFISILLAFVTASLMDRFIVINKAVYPLLIITQTIPSIAIAPLLILWMGYGSAPKITLVVITCYFPLAVSLLSGFASADKDSISLLKAMGASRFQIFIHIKIHCAMKHFFSGLKVAVSYSIIGAVISEWLGGNNGLGVYMTRVKKSYSFDKMFAVIFLISFISLVLMKIVSILEKRFTKNEK